MAGPSPAHLDAYAQQLGYKNYAQWQAVQAQQRMMREAPNLVGQGTTGAPAARPQQPAAPPQNWLQRLLWGLGGGH